MSGNIQSRISDITQMLMDDYTKSRVIGKMKILTINAFSDNQ